MADGVDPKDVYPCDIERIAQNECDFVATYNGCAYSANQAGIPISYSFKQNFIGLGWIGAISKSPNPEGAQKLAAHLGRQALAQAGHFESTGSTVCRRPGFLARVYVSRPGHLSAVAAGDSCCPLSIAVGGLPGSAAPRPARCGAHCR
jgi:hypothetical protein